MRNDRRLSICYVVPGHNLLASAGPTRNVLSLASALSQYAEVTVAFRRVLDPITPDRFKVEAIEPGLKDARPPVHDAALRGVTLGDFMSYLWVLNRFVERTLPAYDVVLEKTWLLSGYLSSKCWRRAIPAIPVENLVPRLDWPWRDYRDIGAYARHWVGRCLAGHFLRRAGVIVAETENLKAAMAEQWGLAPERIEVIGLGVDRELFRPRDQDDARRHLGLDLRATLLLYAGALDRTHNLTPLLEAMAQIPDASLRLHIVGDGPRRGVYERQAAALGHRVAFHGQVPHERVAQYIAAADLCLAPYDASAFTNRQLGYASLKVTEYLSAGRPVVTVPSGRMLELVRPDVTGFLIENDTESWLRLLCACPARAELRRMGEEAACSELDSWADTALAYYSLCDQEVQKMKRVRETVPR